MIKNKLGSELDDLIDEPIEREGLELKSWGGFKYEVQHEAKIAAKRCRLLATLTGIEVANGLHAFDRGRKISD